MMVFLDEDVAVRGGACCWRRVFCITELLQEDVVGGEDIVYLCKIVCRGCAGHAGQCVAMSIAGVLPP